MKLYTRSGDDGTTGLFSGARVHKHDPRIEAYGTVDEANACIGLVMAACDPSRPVEARMLAVFAQMQSRLFDLGADLATPSAGKQSDRVMRIVGTHVMEAEHWIDEFDAMNVPLRAFVMPSGCELAARLHLARTVVRRAERLMVALSMTEEVGAGAIGYMNRLSDLLFAMSRVANKVHGVADVPWVPSTNG